MEKNERIVFCFQTFFTPLRDCLVDEENRKKKMGIAEKIHDIEAEIARTQRNKRTEYHLGLLKAKLAKYRGELLESASKPGKAKAEGFEVEKSGDARVAMIGFPSVGKSTLLSQLTTTESAVAAYDFTTLTCVPGIIEHANGARIQLLDLPGIISGAAVGKGRGRQVVAISRTAELILMLLDASKEDRGAQQKVKLTAELETMGLRLNRKRPDIYLRVKNGGGLVFTSTAPGPLTHLNINVVKDILAVYKIHDAEVIVRYDATVDDFIDTIESAKRVYVPCLYVYNKIDELTIEELDELASQEHSVVISGSMRLNIDYLLDCIWDELQLVRVYTKKQGEAPDFSQPVILASKGVHGAKVVTVKTLCQHLHKDLVASFRYAVVWGKSAKHTPQIVGINHILADEDVVQIVKKI